MKHFMILLLVALVTIAVLFAWYNPGKLEDIWLWVVGMAGTVIGYAREIFMLIQQKIKKIKNIRA